MVTPTSSTNSKSPAPSSGQAGKNLEPLVKAAATLGLQQAGITLSPALQSKILQKLSEGVDQYLDKIAEKKVTGEKVTEETDPATTNPAQKLPDILATIKNNIQTSTQQALDQISRAAAAEVLPQLAQTAPPAMNQATQLSEQDSALSSTSTENQTAAATPPSSTTTSPSAQFMSGLNEGSGEDDTASATAPEKADETTPPPTEETPQTQPTSDDSTTPDEASRTAVTPGQENLPTGDLSQKQKGAFAEQTLQNQLGSETAPQTNTGMQEQAMAHQLQQAKRGRSQNSHAQPNQTEVPGQTTQTNTPQTPEDQLASTEQDIANAFHAIHATKTKHQSSPGSADADAEGQGAHDHKKVNEIAANIGQQLKDNIKTGGFSSFLLALSLSIFKDFLEWVTLFFGDIGFTGTALSTFVGTMLYVTFLGEGLWFKRLLIKRFFGRFIMTLVAELIPGFNMFPWYTISVLLLKMKVDKEIGKQKGALKKLEEEMKELRTAQRRGGIMNQFKLAKIKASLEELRRVADE